MRAQEMSAAAADTPTLSAAEMRDIFAMPPLPSALTRAPSAAADADAAAPPMRDAAAIYADASAAAAIRRR